MTNSDSPSSAGSGDVMDENYETCTRCMGTGISNHPDSNETCYQCSGKGALSLLGWVKTLADNWRGRNGNTTTGDSVRNSCADELERVASKNHILDVAQSVGMPVAWIGRHKDMGVNFGTLALTADSAQSRVMLTGIAGKGWEVIPLYASQPSPADTVETAKGDALTVAVANGLLDAHPRSSAGTETVIGEDGRSRPITLRETIARAALRVIKKPDGVETLDWQIADAVIAALPQPTDWVPASAASFHIPAPNQPTTEPQALRDPICRDCGKPIDASHILSHPRSCIVCDPEFGDPRTSSGA